MIFANVREQIDQIFFQIEIISCVFFRFDVYELTEKHTRKRTYRAKMSMSLHVQVLTFRNNFDSKVDSSNNNGCSGAA